MRLIAFLLLITAAFAQPRPRMGEYALILADPPLAQIAPTRDGLTSRASLDHSRKLRAAQRTVLADLARRRIAVRQTSTLLVNAIFVDAAHASAPTLAAIPRVQRIQFL